MNRTLSDQDMIDILEDIAKNGGNAAARIAAIKVLREIAGGRAGARTRFRSWMRSRVLATS